MDGELLFSSNTSDTLSGASELVTYVGGVDQNWKHSLVFAPRLLSPCINFRHDLLQFTFLHFP